MQSIGIFGGTFDPIHFGHLRMAEELRVQLGLEQVRFLPSARPPHRDHTHTSTEHRTAMARLAIADNPAFVLDTLELERDGPSYTVDTLRDLRGTFGPDTPLMLLIGSDAFLGLSTWHRWQELTKYAHIVVASRPGAEFNPETLPPALHAFWQRHVTHHLHDLNALTAGRLFWQPITALDVASHKIRDAYAKNFSTRYLLPETVRDYIESHHLYARKAT